MREQRDRSQFRFAVVVGLVVGVVGLMACGKPLPPVVSACEGTSLLQRSEDPAIPGPWAVGSKTITLAGLTTDVWYPAAWGSEGGKEPKRYDIRQALPAEEQGKIPDEKAPIQICSCFEDLPLDQERGPYPVLLFLHGTASFRTQSLTFLTHWASRGFVVFSADHPGLKLGDLLQLQFGAKQEEDAKALLSAIREGKEPLGFLAGKLDLGRIGVAGHSAGGSSLARLGQIQGVQVLIPMAAGGTEEGSFLRSSLILGGQIDRIVPYTRQTKGYETSPKKKRLIGIANAGHLAFSDLCDISKADGGLLPLAKTYKVKIPEGFDVLIEALASDGCKEGDLPSSQAFPILLSATSSAFEEILHCSPKATTRLQQLQTTYPAIAELQESL